MITFSNFSPEIFAYTLSLKLNLSFVAASLVIVSGDLLTRHGIDLLSNLINNKSIVK